MNNISDTVFEVFRRVRPDGNLLYNAFGAMACLRVKGPFSGFVDLCLNIGDRDGVRHTLLNQIVVRDGNILRGSELFREDDDE